MSAAIEISPRLRGILERTAEGQAYLREVMGQQTWLESLHPRNILKTLWRHKGKILTAATILSLGSSAGLWAKIAPWAGKLGETIGGWIGQGAGGRSVGEGAMSFVDSAGQWFSGRGRDFWTFLKNTWNTIPGVAGWGVPEGVEGAHKSVVDFSRTNLTDRIPPP